MVWERGWGDWTNRAQMYRGPYGAPSVFGMGQAPADASDLSPPASKRVRWADQPVEQPAPALQRVFRPVSQLFPQPFRIPIALNDRTVNPAWPGRLQAMSSDDLQRIWDAAEQDYTKNVDASVLWPNDQKAAMLSCFLDQLKRHLDQPDSVSPQRSVPVDTITIREPAPNQTLSEGVGSIFDHADTLKRLLLSHQDQYLFFDPSELVQPVSGRHVSELIAVGSKHVDHAAELYRQQTDDMIDQLFPVKDPDLQSACDLFAENKVKVLDHLLDTVANKALHEISLYRPLKAPEANRVDEARLASLAVSSKLISNNMQEMSSGYEMMSSSFECMLPVLLSQLKAQHTTPHEHRHAVDEAIHRLCFGHPLSEPKDSHQLCLKDVESGDLHRMDSLSNLCFFMQVQAQVRHHELQEARALREGVEDVDLDADLAEARQDIEKYKEMACHPALQMMAPRSLIEGLAGYVKDLCALDDVPRDGETHVMNLQPILKRIQYFEDRLDQYAGVLKSLHQSAPFKHDMRVSPLTELVLKGFKTTMDEHDAELRCVLESDDPSTANQWQCCLRQYRSVLQHHSYKALSTQEQD